jgi:phage shock protein E
VLILIIFVLSMYIYTLTGIRLIPASQAKRLIKSGEITQIVDIRTKTEYDLGHYPNSVHIPVNKINKNTVQKLDKEKPTLVYCNTGQRARYAANKLDKLGFREVYYIDGTYDTIM